MGDIFDDIKAMEDAASASTAEVTADPGDANFSASELDDIMAEIDNLEKDFEAEVVSTTPIAAAAQVVVEPTPEVTKVETVAKVEETIESAPVEMVPEMVTETVKEETPVETKVLSFEKKPEPVAVMPELKTSTTSNVALTATGNMALNLAFKIGEENATLFIDQEKGLIVSFSGVEICLHAEKGCTVEMAGGVSFTVPVQSGAASKKKSA